MGIFYFLALPLSEKDLAYFLNFAKRWAPFLNQDLYLSLISYDATAYLAKEISSFPCTLEQWQKAVNHVSSLLTHTFLRSSVDSLLFLACRQFTQIELPALTN
ncbi:hypothetical protein NVRI1_00577 [Chlamydia abortus]|uniref:hypothetical protein n=1 Tax=Chlamydia abortus TaxID=83555 RepID=UPI00192C7217|nr:hypothetical protein [Chlamydia abortus]CAD7583714.1 hypothetical protein [Chlamydia abortus]CAG9046228.1 hypothetical protein NVRI1_00577 [Chlamydia abortus]